MRLMAIYIATAVLSLASGVGFGEDPDGNHSAATRDANNAMTLGRMERSAPVKKIDECNEGVIESNAAPPNWDSPAVTTQCGVLELDSLFTRKL